LGNDLTLASLKNDIVDEVSTILDSNFEIEVTETSFVPHSDDAAITFPNLDDGTQKTKLLESCVLYVDMRRSTQLSLKHRTATVAKLYTSFVRAMTYCASEYGGEIRGIIGDRVMMVFEKDKCFENAVDTAQLINSVCEHVLNRAFKKGELSFGIGIDYGRMLVTKTGVRRHGSAQQSYRNLVWLGRPANIASKLTDQANKPAEHVTVDAMNVAYGTVFGQWNWQKEYLHEFVSKLIKPAGGVLAHIRPDFLSFIPIKETIRTREKMPPILMTEAVFDGFKRARPNANSIKNSWYKEVRARVEGYSGKVYGGDVVFTVFRDGSA
jgi:adenylate cyclase